MTQDNGGSIATILFVDLIDSSDAASFMGTKAYQVHLRHFHKVIEGAWNDLVEQENLKRDPQKNSYEYEIRGDEGFFLFAGTLNEEDSKRTQDIQGDILKSLKLALSIKYRWQLDKNNIEQIEGNKKPFEIAIGINSGIVSFSKKLSNKNNSCKYKAEGYAINLAKRIEGEARKGTYSRIFVGETTYGLYSDSPGDNPVRFQRQELAPLKGISGDIRIYEMAAAGIEDEEERAILVMPEEWKTSHHLIKNDPHSRRILMTSYNPAQASEGVLYPCHSITIQFYVQDQYLDMSCYNRSQDLFLGVPYNIASSALLLSTVAKLTFKKPRHLSMVMGDAHLYECHLEQTRLQTERIPYAPPSLVMPDIESLDDIPKLKASDFKIENYKCHKSIKGAMVA